MHCLGVGQRSRLLVVATAARHRDGRGIHRFEIGNGPRGCPRVMWARDTVTSRALGGHNSRECRGRNMLGIGRIRVALQWPTRCPRLRSASGLTGTPRIRVGKAAARPAISLTRLSCRRLVGPSTTVRGSTHLATSPRLAVVGAIGAQQQEAGPAQPAQRAQRGEELQRADSVGGIRPLHDIERTQA